MNVSVDIRENKVVPRLMEVMGEAGRRDLNEVAANELAEFVARHIRSYAGSKHGTARRFGARATGHYTKGAAAISTHADANEASVTIPIPGLSRAFRDVVITPKRSKTLTVPLPSGGETVYGRTVGELRALGWNFFPRKGILFGYREGVEAKAMFALKSVVRQARDPSLLPSMDDMAERASKAMLRRVAEVLGKARNERKTA